MSMSGPAWLWSGDGTRLLWANAAGAAILGVGTDALQTPAPAGSTVAREIARLATSLPRSGRPQLARLRGLGGGATGSPPTYSCARLPLAGGDSAILVARQDLSPLTATPPASASDGGAGAPRDDDQETPGEPMTTALAATTPPQPSALDGIEARFLARQHPFRFVWQTDAEMRLVSLSDAFAALAGPQTAAMVGRSWPEIAAALGLDADGAVARAMAGHDTWSGLALAWPVEGTGLRLPVTLSGMPAFAADRAFAGYRGFGICRDLEALAAALAARRASATAAPRQAVRGGPAAEDAGGAGAPPEAEAPATAPLPPQETPPTRAEAPPHHEPPPIVPDSMPDAVRPQLTVVPTPKNVVPFRPQGNGGADKRPGLSSVERNAFQEIAKALGARLETPESAAEPAPPSPPPGGTTADDAATGDTPAAAPVAQQPETSEPAKAAAAPPAADAERAVLDRMPVAVLAYRGERLIYANRAFFAWTGYADVGDLAAAGGLAALFCDPSLEASDEADAPSRALCVKTRAGAKQAIDARLFSVPWDGEPTLLLMFTRAPNGGAGKRGETATREAQALALELKSILDTATDGVIITDDEGNILAGNRSAEALFGYDTQEIVGQPFTDLFAPESHRAALDYLDGLTRSGVLSVLNDGREVIGRVRQGGLIPLFMTMGRVSEEPVKFCAVFRDITQWKRAEEELTSAKRQAERASSAKSDFLAKISHEIRTPLNAIIGFSEVMLEESFGPIGNERYKTYIRDIHTSGEHMVSLLNDLLDLSKIEAGKLDLNFVRVDLNEVTQQAVALMQPQANRQRVIIRTSLSPALPAVVADERSTRQIVLNLLSNSVKFTGAGGQVIVSTALTERGEAVLRVRDTGVGMSEKEIATALEPFRQLQTSSRFGSAGTGLGLPLTKALAEANRATFSIKSAVNAGTLIEIIFPSTRVLAE